MSDFIVTAKYGPNKVSQSRENLFPALCGGVLPGRDVELHKRKKPEQGAVAWEMAGSFGYRSPVEIEGSPHSGI